jgi:hypothetical protein
MTAKNSDLKSLRLIVLISGTLLALLFLLAFVPKMLINSSDKVHTPDPSREWEGQVMLAMFITYLIGYALGWLWRLWGGIIIIIAALVVSIPFILLDENYGSLIFGIPQFVVGVLYILLYRFEKSGNNESLTK